MKPTKKHTVLTIGELTNVSSITESSDSEPISRSPILPFLNDDLFTGSDLLKLTSSSLLSISSTVNLRKLKSFLLSDHRLLASFLMLGFFASCSLALPHSALALATCSLALALLFLGRGLLFFEGNGSNHSPSSSPWASGLQHHDQQKMDRSDIVFNNIIAGR